MSQIFMTALLSKCTVNRESTIKQLKQKLRECHEIYMN